MKRILLAIDAVNIDRSALEFATWLTRITRSSLTGIFLENLIADEKPVLKKMADGSYLDFVIDENSPAFLEKRKLIENSLTMFSEVCEKRSIRYHIRRDSGVPAREMIEESRFADLVILDAATSFRHEFEGLPTDFVKKVMEDAECPVIIAPENFSGINEIVFAYDGSASSVFAVKQFTYLFPEMCGKPVTLFHVEEGKVWQEPEMKRIREWLLDHYASVNFETMKGEVSTELFSYLFNKKNIFIVMGAYGRGAVSRYFRHSNAEILIKTISHPVFITHH